MSDTKNIGSSGSRGGGAGVWTPPPPPLAHNVGFFLGLSKSSPCCLSHLPVGRRGWRGIHDSLSKLSKSVCIIHRPLLHHKVSKRQLKLGFCKGSKNFQLDKNVYFNGTYNDKNKLETQPVLCSYYKVTGNWVKHVFIDMMWRRTHYFRLKQN